MGCTEIKGVIPPLLSYKAIYQHHHQTNTNTMAQVLVVYPSGPSFDLDYYLKTHMPLVSSYVSLDKPPLSRNKKTDLT